MFKQKKLARFLLMQFRHESTLRHQEWQAIKHIAKLKRSQLIAYDAIAYGPPDNETIDDYHAVIIGGASDFCVSQTHNSSPITECISLTRDIIDSSKPLLGICFGFHMIIKALGGSISYEPNKPELGGVSINLSPQSNNDPLFKGIKKTIKAISAHQDMVYLYQLPPECVPLADNQRCLQAVRVKNKPIWGLQFHAEAIPKLIKAQFSKYYQSKNKNNAQLKEILKTFVKTPEANRLISNFAQFVQKNHYDHLN